MAGRRDSRNAHYVLATLDRAIAGAMAGEYDAIVTAPVQKSVINDARIPFTGHTEYLAERTGTPRVVMMLAGETPHGPLRVALATTHLPIASVPGALSIDGVAAVLKILITELQSRFGIDYAARRGDRLESARRRRRPHGTRRNRTLLRLRFRACACQGHHVDGPLPADTVFVPSLVQRYDAVLAMFHDQGLPVLKYATFGHGVNITLGLPFVRTSVDHGTALDLAGYRTRRRRQHAGGAEACDRTGAPQPARAARRSSP